MENAARSTESVSASRDQQAGRCAWGGVNTGLTSVRRDEPDRGVGAWRPSGSTHRSPATGPSRSPSLYGCVTPGAVLFAAAGRQVSGRDLVGGGRRAVPTWPWLLGPAMGLLSSERRRAGAGCPVLPRGGGLYSPAQGGARGRSFSRSSPCPGAAWPAGRAPSAGLSITGVTAPPRASVSLTALSPPHPPPRGQRG